MIASFMSRARALLESHHAPIYAALLGVLLSLPTVVSGLLLDDHLFRARALRGGLGLEFELLDGPVAQLREQGSLGWWAADELQLSFMRPLAALWHGLDFWLWPQAAWLMHLENVILYAVLIVAVGRLLQRLLGPGPIAGLACLMFAVDEMHATAVMWISARNSLLAALFGVLALAAHARWRTQARAGERGWPLAAAAVSCFVLALSSGEIGLMALGYVVADALVHEQGVRSRMAALWPYLAVVAAWRMTGAYLGIGAQASGLYVEPSADPLGFVTAALLQTPALAFSVLSLPIADGLTNTTEPIWFIAAALGFVALACLFAPLRDDPRACSLGLGLILAALPLASTAPTSRTSMMLGLGSVGVVALAWARRHTPAFSGRARRYGLRAVMACQLVLAPLLFVPLSFAPLLVESPHRALAEQVTGHEDVVAVLNLPAEINALYPAAISTAAGRDWPAHCYLLFAGMASVEVERLDAHALMLRSEAGWAASRVDRLSRAWARQGFAVGDRVELERAVIDVVEVSPDGRPLQVRVTFTDELDAVTLLGFDGASLVRWRPAIGERVEWTAGLSVQ